MHTSSRRSNSRRALAFVAVLWIATGTGAQTTYLPDESAPHEGTWLQWPHQYTYGLTYRNRLDATWTAMTGALVASERVHIVAYNATEQTRITGLLTAAGVVLTNVDFLVRQNDDCWVRDNGPIFVHDSNGLKLTDWKFNGWGLDTPYALDDTVPQGVSAFVGVPRVNLASTELEGGAIEVDGQGVLMATRSSILELNRNPGLTQAQLQVVLTANLGVTKFIWLNGAPGGQIDITDMHIDGFARFGPARSIVTMSSTDLSYWGLPAGDITTLFAATDVASSAYSFVLLPLTVNNVVTTYGLNLGFKGSYVNYYVANTVVLVPTYNDPNDNVAKNIIQQLYPGRTVIGIDVRNLYNEGGMVHCVTQQQPAALPHGPFCSGDGTDATCPCGNPGAPGRGCNNQAASGGAQLTSSGSASISGDTLVLSATGAIAFGPGLYFQGSTTPNPTAPFGLAFGNGLQCAGGITPRLEVQFANGSGASSTTVPIHVLGSTRAGDVRRYQLWYRDSPAFGVCASGFNLSNALSLLWIP